MTPKEIKGSASQQEYCCKWGGTLLASAVVCK